LLAVKALLSATVRVTDRVFEQHSPFCPHTVGRQLAEQIDAHVQSESLGYYPALDYFQNENMLDQESLEVLDQLAWLATGLVQDEVRLRLRPIFASVQVQSMQAAVYTMPPVRPSQPGALERLAEHLTPNRAKFDLMLTLFRKVSGAEYLDSYIKRVVYRHLSDVFETVEIGNIKILE